MLSEILKMRTPIKGEKTVSLKELKTILSSTKDIRYIEFRNISELEPYSRMVIETDNYSILVPISTKIEQACVLGDSKLMLKRLKGLEEGELILKDGWLILQSRLGEIKLAETYPLTEDLPSFELEYLLTIEQSVFKILEPYILHSRKNKHKNLLQVKLEQKDSGTRIVATTPEILMVKDYSFNIPQDLLFPSPMLYIFDKLKAKNLKLYKYQGQLGFEYCLESKGICIFYSTFSYPNYEKIFQSKEPICALKIETEDLWNLLKTLYSRDKYSIINFIGTKNLIKVEGDTEMYINLPMKQNGKLDSLCFEVEKLIDLLEIDHESRWIEFLVFEDNQLTPIRVSFEKDPERIVYTIQAERT